MLYEMIAVVSAAKVSCVSNTQYSQHTRFGYADHTTPTKSKSAPVPRHWTCSNPKIRDANIFSSSRIARTAGNLILAQGGVVRGITNWGPFLLTKPTKKNQMRHDSGHHFIMRFDASPEVQQLVRKTIAIDPRMIRCGVVKMGERLKDIVDVKGTVDWQRRRADLGSGYF